MGHVKDHRMATRHVFHNVDAKHVDHQVIVTKVTAAIAQDHLIVTAFLEFVDDIAHLARADELWLLDVDHRTGFRHRFHQIGLTRQECWQLDHVNHFGHRLSL
ncbi:hypothetical protein D3C71_1601630 [compost metagenome]